MYELNNLLPAPVVSNLEAVIDQLSTTLDHVKACLGTLESSWDTFEAQNAPCSRWDDHERFLEWWDSEEVQTVYEPFYTEQSRLEENIEWIETNIKNLQGVLQSLEYMDAEGILQKS